LFAQFLIKENIVQDATPLFKAAADCRINNSEKGIWKYSVENLIFRKMGSIKVFQNNNFDHNSCTFARDTRNF
jgi:hypothetical protein